jgi:FixJ family two-component response regulator
MQIRFLCSSVCRAALASCKCGLKRDRESRYKRTEVAKLEARYASLTPGGREVLPLVLSGLLNRQAAAELGINAVILQIHRSRVMQKDEGPLDRGIGTYDRATKYRALRSNNAKP